MTVLSIGRITDGIHHRIIDLPIRRYEENKADAENLFGHLRAFGCFMNRDFEVLLHERAISSEERDPARIQLFISGGQVSSDM